MCCQCVCVCVCLYVCVCVCVCVWCVSVMGLDLEVHSSCVKDCPCPPICHLTFFPSPLYVETFSYADLECIPQLRLPLPLDLSLTRATHLLHNLPGMMRHWAGPNCLHWVGLVFTAQCSVLLWGSLRCRPPCQPSKLALFLVTQVKCCGSLRGQSRRGAAPAESRWCVDESALLLNGFYRRLRCFVIKWVIGKCFSLLHNQ